MATQRETSSIHHSIHRNTTKDASPTTHSSLPSGGESVRFDAFLADAAKPKQVPADQPHANAPTPVPPVRSSVRSIQKSGMLATATAPPPARQIKGYALSPADTVPFTIGKPDHETTQPDAAHLAANLLAKSAPHSLASQAASEQAVGKGEPRGNGAHRGGAEATQAAEPNGDKTARTHKDAGRASSPAASQANGSNLDMPRSKIDASMATSGPAAPSITAIPQAHNTSTTSETSPARPAAAAQLRAVAGTATGASAGLAVPSPISNAATNESATGAAPVREAGGSSIATGARAFQPAGKAGAKPGLMPHSPTRAGDVAAWGHVGRSIAAALRTGGDLSLRLSPEALGSVVVTMRREEAGVVVTLKATDAQTVQSLRDGVDGLRASLVDKGVNVLRIDVTTMPHQLPIEPVAGDLNPSTPHLSQSPNYQPPHNHSNDTAPVTAQDLLAGRDQSSNQRPSQDSRSPYASHSNTAHPDAHSSLNDGDEAAAQLGDALRGTRLASMSPISTLGYARVDAIV